MKYLEVCHAQEYLVSERRWRKGRRGARVADERVRRVRKREREKTVGSEVAQRGRCGAAGIPRSYPTMRLEGVFKEDRSEVRQGI